MQLQFVEQHLNTKQPVRNTIQLLLLVLNSSAEGRGAILMATSALIRGLGLLNLFLNNFSAASRGIVLVNPELFNHSQARPCLQNLLFCCGLWRATLRLGNGGFKTASSSAR
jgi:hypothetical protein